MLFYVTTALVAVATALYWICTSNFNFWKKKNVPGPKPTPFFGNIKDNVLRRKHVGEVMKAIYKQFKHEKLVGIYRMKTPWLMVNDLDLVKDVLIKNFDAFADRGMEFRKEEFGANLFHANEETWRLLRNRFSPLFTSGKLKNMFHLLDERSDKFVEYLSVNSPKVVERDIKTLLQMYTTSAISACAFGVDINLQDKDQMEVYSNIDKQIFTLSYFTEFDFMFPGILKKLNLSPVTLGIRNLFHDLVKNVLIQRNGKPSGRKDFMDLILELNQCEEVKSKDEHDQICLKITKDIMAAQAFIFYAAGYETSATTMTFMLYHLARNQEIQEKVKAEIDEVLERYFGKIAYEGVSEMKYIHQVLDETLRMYPIIETLQRNANRDYNVPGTDVTIKKGQMIMIPVIGIQHDERYYPNPEVFDPDRFTAENIRNRHSCAYLPFGAGPRNCIGMRFGKLQTLLGVVKLMINFRLEPSTKTQKSLQVDPERIVYGPLGEVNINFIQRY